MRLTMPLLAIRSPMGGIESSIYNFTRALRTTDAELTVAIGKEDYLAPNFLAWLKVQPISIEHYRSFGPKTIHRLLDESWFALHQKNERVIYPNYFLPPLRRPGSFNGVIIHDIQFKSLPDYFTPKRRRWLDTIYRTVRRGADSMMFVSEFERQQFFRHYGESFAARTHVINVPIDWARYDGEPSEAMRALASRPYIFTIAHRGAHDKHLYLHKNLDTLIAAFAILAQTDKDIALIFAGRPAANIEAAAKALAPDIAARVHFTGFVSDADLGLLHRSASLFAMPSRYEGFGMPPVEALGFGRPVLVSDAASLKEVTLGKANYLPAFATAEEWANAMGQLLGTPGDAELSRKVRETYSPMAIGNRIVSAMRG